MHSFLSFACLSLVLLLLVNLHFSSAQRTADEWKNRTIYQLLTDRFAQSNPTTNGCGDLSNYCGGTFQGIIHNLDYITEMGFDAIWISPVITNTQGGYHGYWAQDFNSINSQFGSAQDLQQLVSAAHQKGVWVMVDIVVNHVGPVGDDFSSINPFNEQSDYHPDCDVSEYNCFTNEVLVCRLAGLPDLNQNDSTVRQQLIQYGTNLIQQYGIDGFRADTVMYIDQNFWQEFQNAVGAYIVGEVWSTVSCGVAYQQNGITGILNYPMFYAIRSAFQSGGSLTQLNSAFEALSSYPDPDALGTFVDNHDNTRFLYQNDNKGPQYLNALTYVLLSQGIPIIYYGSEQNFDGGNDPNCREVLWPTNFNTQTDTYKFIQQVISIRKQYQVWNHPQIQHYVSDQVFVFTRGDILVALVNQGGTYSAQITSQPYSDGTKLCNLFDATRQDCVTVQNGQFTITLGLGYPKIYAPSN